MTVEAENAIAELLTDSEEPLTFPEIKESCNVRGQDLRKGLRFLVENRDVCVSGVRDKQKTYTYND